MSNDLSVIVGGTVESVHGDTRGLHGVTVRCVDGSRYDVLLSAKYAIIPEPICPLCSDVHLDVDTQSLMEDHGEHWELVLPALGEDEIPYSCLSCGQEGTLDDFDMIAKELRREVSVP